MGSAAVNAVRALLEHVPNIQIVGVRHEQQIDSGPLWVRTPNGRVAVALRLIREPRDSRVSDGSHFPTECPGRIPAAGSISVPGGRSISPEC